jgi:hypothetical protein
MLYLQKCCSVCSKIEIFFGRFGGPDKSLYFKILSEQKVTEEEK